VLSLVAVGIGDLVLRGFAVSIFISSWKTPTLQVGKPPCSSWWGVFQLGIKSETANPPKIKSHLPDNMRSASYTPRVFSPAESVSIIEKRRQGLYHTKDTYDEALICVRQLKEVPNDKVSTLIRHLGYFNVFDTKEFMEQVKDWKAKGVKILKCNINDIQCGAYGEACLFTVTPPNDEDCAFCPLALAFNTMVSGYSYITKDKALAELAWRYLGSHE